MDCYQLSDCKITISINWKLTHATVFLQVEFKLHSRRRKNIIKNAKDFTVASRRLVLIIPWYFYVCLKKVGNNSSPLVSCSFYLPRSLSL